MKTMMNMKKLNVQSAIERFTPTGNQNTMAFEENVIYVELIGQSHKLHINF